MTTPQVSIVVTCYNGGHFLDALMVSLEAQTFRDFEVVIVDDGSSDEKTHDKLASLKPDIRVVRQPNSGLPAARNTGFRKAQAALVLPLDQDDTLEPSFLAETVSALNSAPPMVSFVFTHMRLTGGLDRVLPRHLNQFDQLFLNQLPYSMLIRKAAWEAVGGYDEGMRNGYEDWEFNMRLWHAGYSGIEIAKPLFIYYVSSDGMLLSRSARMHGSLWAYMRRKHADIYRMSPLISAWQKARGNPGKVSLFAAAGLIGMATLLPESWFNAVYYRLFMASRDVRIS